MLKSALPEPALRASGSVNTDRLDGLRPSHAGVARPDVPDTAVVRVMFTLLVVSVTGQNFVIPFSGATVFADVIPLYVASAVLFYINRLTVSPIRLMLFLAAFVPTVVLQTLVVPGASLSSMFLAIVIYLPFIGVVRTTMATYMRVLFLFQYLVLAIALLVYLDLAVQLVGLEMPSIQSVVPASLLVQSYVYIQPIMYGASINKPNAFFMLEASFTSQFIALGLVTELAFFRRRLWVGAFCIALLGTFATTGLILAAVCIPIIYRRKWASMLTVGAVVLPLLGAVGYASGWIEVQLQRLDKVDRQASSFSQRFVIPYTAMWDLATTGSQEDIIAGYGAGATTRNLEVAEYNTISRSFLEYGIIFFVSFLTFLTLCFASSGVPSVVVIASLVNYHFLSGNFHLPSTVNYCYALVVGYAITKIATVPIRNKAYSGFQYSGSIE